VKTIVNTSKKISIDVKTATTKQLVDFYNEHSGSTKPLAKFKDRETAERRVTELVTAHNELVGNSSKPSAVKKAAKAAKTSKADASEDSGKRGRPSSLAGQKLYPLVKDNPRREGTCGHKSFGLITKGMTYEAYIEAGGRARDLAWDIAHNYVEAK
jgi:hypothetical protein